MDTVVVSQNVLFDQGSVFALGGRFFQIPHHILGILTPHRKRLTTHMITHMT